MENEHENELLGKEWLVAGWEQILWLRTEPVFCGSAILHVPVEPSSWRDLRLPAGSHWRACGSFLLHIMSKKRKFEASVDDGLSRYETLHVFDFNCWGLGKPYSRVARCRREVSFWSRLPGWVLRRLYFLFELHRFLLSWVTGRSVACNFIKMVLSYAILHSAIGLMLGRVF